MTSGTASWTGRGRLVAATLVALSLLAACGETVVPSPSAAAATPRPTPTPNAHLSDPAAGTEVYTRLNRAGLGLVGTNALSGKEPRTTYNATYAGWPLSLLEFSSATTRAKALPFRDGGAPAKGSPPFTFAGQNIVVFWGPIEASAAPPQPDASHLEAATKLAVALDALVGPLQERSSSRVSPLPPIAAPAP
ncbi:MAG: hypothetical protein ABWY52_03750 [Candidatus Limnocylindrales bacterium]